MSPVMLDCYDFFSSVLQSNHIFSFVNIFAIMCHMLYLKGVCFGYGHTLLCLSVPKGHMFWERQCGVFVARSQKPVIWERTFNFMSAVPKCPCFGYGRTKYSPRKCHNSDHCVCIHGNAIRGGYNGENHGCIHGICILGGHNGENHICIHGNAIQGGHNTMAQTVATPDSCYLYRLCVRLIMRLS